MSVPPQVNATLTGIHAPGFTENYDKPDASGPVKWTGESGCYVREQTLTSFSAGELNRVLVTKVYFDSELEVDSPVKSGDTLIYEFRSLIFTGKIQDLVTRRLPGVPTYTAATMEQVNAA